MESPTVSKKQPIHIRLMFFVLGGGMSSLLNTGIFRISHKLFHWPDSAAYGLSVVTTAVVFFVWSYYVNFRTTRVWKDCLPRYLGCLVICNALQLPHRPFWHQKIRHQLLDDAPRGGGGLQFHRLRKVPAL